MLPSQDTIVYKRLMDEAEPTHIVVPPSKLSSEALDALLEEYILRDGTDYGSVELTLEAKKARAKRQLEAGHVQIVYSTTEESCTILTSKELKLRA